MMNREEPSYPLKKKKNQTYRWSSAIIRVYSPIKFTALLYGGMLKWRKHENACIGETVSGICYWPYIIKSLNKSGLFIYRHNPNHMDGLQGRNYHVIDTGELVHSVAFGITSNTVKKQRWMYQNLTSTVVLATGHKSGRIKLWNCETGRF